jgi:outer membrane protein TolC
MTLVAPAQTNPPPAKVRQLSLRDCVELALKNNLELQIYRYNPQLQLFTLRSDYSAYDPSFSLSGKHDYNKSGAQVFGTNIYPPSVRDDNTFSSGLGGVLPTGAKYTLSGSAADTYGSSYPENATASSTIQVTQPLLKNLWIDQSRLTIRVDKNRLKYSEQTLRLQIIQTLTALEQAYYDLIYDRQNVLVQEKAVELAERLVMENKKKLEVGTIAVLDLQSAEAQAASSRASVIQAQSQLGTQERLVKQFLTDQYSLWSDVTIVPVGTLTAPPPVLSLHDSWNQGLTQRPELLQAKLDLEKAGIQLKFSYNQLFPELDIFGTYGFSGSSPQYSGAFHEIRRGDAPLYTYGGQLSVPLANISARYGYRTSKAQLQQALLALKKWERDIMIGIDNDIGTIRANYDAVRATHAATEYAAAALDAEEKKLASGKSTTYTVLQMQRDLTTDRGLEIQAVDTYNKSLVQLSQDEGSTLDRLGIDFELVK